MKSHHLHGKCFKKCVPQICFLGVMNQSSWCIQMLDYNPILTNNSTGSIMYLAEKKQLSQPVHKEHPSYFWLQSKLSGLHAYLLESCCAPPTASMITTIVCVHVCGETQMTKLCCIRTISAERPFNQLGVVLKIAHRRDGLNICEPKTVCIIARNLSITCRSFWKHDGWVIPITTSLRRNTSIHIV